MKTATQWLFEKLWDDPKDKLTWYAILAQAKEMEKEQMKNSLLENVTKNGKFRSVFEEQFEQYYTETFKNK